MPAELQKQRFGKQNAVREAESKFATEKNRMAAQARRLQSQLTSLQNEIDRYKESAASVV